MKLKLIKADAPEGSRYTEQVMAYREEMLANGDTLDGCGGLESVSSFVEWIDFDRRLRAKYGENYTPSEVYLAVRCNDDQLVGIIDFRHPLSESLKKFGGNIGYSVRPSERRKGYATEMLRMLLPICRSAGERRVLLTCDKNNIGSRKTILANGGVLENEIARVAPSNLKVEVSGITQRYWITLD